MDETGLEAQAADVKSGVSKENQTLRLMFDPQPGITPSSIVSEVGSRLEGRRGTYFLEFGAVLLGHGPLRITEVVNFAGGGAGQGKDEEENGVHREATVEGEFYLFRVPQVGQELVVRVTEITKQKLSCVATGGVELIVIQDAPSWKDLYVGQKILCRVDNVQSLGNGQMRLVGKLLESLPSIALSLSNSSGAPLQTEKRRRPESISEGNEDRRRNKKPRVESVSEGSIADTVKERVRHESSSSAVEILRRDSSKKIDEERMEEENVDSPKTSKSKKSKKTDKEAEKGMDQEDFFSTNFSQSEKSVPSTPEKSTSKENIPASKTPKSIIVAPEGFTVERSGAKNQIKLLWVKFKGKKMEFKTIKAARAWVAQNSNYLDNMEEPEVKKNDDGAKQQKESDDESDDDSSYEDQPEVKKNDDGAKQQKESDDDDDSDTEEQPVVKKTDNDTGAHRDKSSDDDSDSSSSDEEDDEEKESKETRKNDAVDKSKNLSSNDDNGPKKQKESDSSSSDESDDEEEESKEKNKNNVSDESRKPRKLSSDKETSSSDDDDEDDAKEDKKAKETEKKPEQSIVNAEKQENKKKVVVLKNLKIPKDSSSDEDTSSSDDEKNNDVKKSVKGIGKAGKDQKGGKKEKNKKIVESDSTDSETDPEEKTDSSSVRKESVSQISVKQSHPQTEKKSESQPSVLSSTVLHGHSKKNTPAIPDGISPIQATKLKKVEIQAPLKLFDKMASLSESRDDENNTSHDGDKGKKPKKKKKKKTKVPGFMN